jgi:malonyl-CoA/methylmalonyl-CoA synthetase
MNIISLFNHSLINKKDKVALTYHQATYTFGELDSRSNQMANILKKKGLAMGDRLCLYAENSVVFIDIYIACIKLGIIFVPVNILYKERELLHIYNDAKPAVFISSVVIPGEIIQYLDMNTLAEEAQQASSIISNISETITGDTPAAIIYTSGTTGASKGAVLTNNNFLVNALNLITCWEISSNDHLLLALPLFHVHGLANGLHTWLISGCSVKLLERFEHQKAAEEFLNFKPTLFFGVPTMYIRMLDFNDLYAKQIGSFVRLFVSGSAPLPSQVLEAFKEKYYHVILERYGMTETLMNISNPFVGERRAGTVGLPLPGVSAKIVNTDGEEVSQGEEGELLIKGGNVFKEYWHRDEATKQSFVDGYFKTGDMAICTTDGYYTLKGRKSDLIISGGFNIYPREIEEYLMEQEGIAEAAVVGMPHALRGEVPIAYIVQSSDNLNLESVEERCKQIFASFKIPKAFIKVDQLPRTALGKVQKHLLPKP